MNNVAMNLVATMMQNKFSNSYVSSTNGTSSQSFKTVLSSSKNNSYENTYDQGIKTSQNYEQNNDFEQKVDRSQTSDVANKQNNLNKLDQQNEPKETKSNDEAKQVENEDPGIVKDVKEVKDLNPSEDKINDELSEVEEELVNELATQLNMDPEEIKNLLNELQLTISDLFDMDNLQMFMTSALDVSSPMELVVTDGASEKVQEVMKTLESALSVNPELAKEVLNMDSHQGENAETNDVELAKLIETIQNQSTDTNQNQSESGRGDSELIETAKGSNGLKAETTQNTSGFEGMLNQVVTQKTETIIMNGSIQTIQTEVTAKDVFDQIVTGMKVQVSESKSNITLQLQPYNLGKIALNLSSENGSITGHFVAETEAVKEVLEANILQLKNQLQEQGVNISEIKITVGSSASFFTGQEEEENTSKQSFNNKNNKRGKIGNINEILADKLSEDMMEQENEVIHEDSSIELHA